jgi:FAD/FMN-containing dehydrogenase
MRQDGLIRALRGIVGPDAVFTDEETLERFSFDALGPARLFDRPELMKCRVDAVVRPATTQQVSGVVRLADQRGVPIVPYGGGTGVMGAVIPVRGGIALDMRGMDRILEVLPADRLARVQPGVLLADLDREAQCRGLMLGHDPWSLSIATVGGAISTDSVGYRASKYGSMGDQVRALEVVLADGSIVRTRSLARASSGPALNRLFAGAEGTMGVITEATVQLFGQPEERAFATVGFASFEAGFPMVARLFDLGLVPALVDLTEEEPDEAASGFPCLLYLGFEGYAQEVAAQRERALAEGIVAGGVDLGPGPTERYWKHRHDSAERWRQQMQPLRPTERWAQHQWRAADYLHLSLPVSAVLDYYRQAHAIVAEHDLLVREAAVWTDPRLFSLFIADPRDGEGRAAEQSRLGPVRPEPVEGRIIDEETVLAKAVDRLLRLALAMGGGIEYCHGIGVKLAPLMADEWADALPLARRLKGSLDPRRTLNPDKLGL